MDQGSILLKLICDKIGLGALNLDTFDERLCLQKKIYCVQVAGLDLGYRYNWHIKGPYCPALTRVAFLLKEDIKNDGKDLKKYTLSSKADTCIETAKKFWNIPQNVREAIWLELLVSLHYLKTIAYWPKGTATKTEVMDRLLESKPAFKSKTDLREKAWKRLEDFGLLEKRSLAS